MPACSLTCAEAEATERVRSMVEAGDEQKVARRYTDGSLVVHLLFPESSAPAFAGVGL
jgi:hypothetical protein